MSLWLAGMALAFAGPSTCSAARPLACDAMWELWRAPGFEASLHRFLGRGRLFWLSQQQRLTDFVPTYLDVSSDGPVRSKSGLVRFEGCVPHVCTESGAVFLTTSGEIRMVALLSRECAGNCPKGPGAYTLFVIVRQRSEALSSDAAAWASALLAAQAKRFPALVSEDDAVGATRIVFVHD